MRPFPLLNSIIFSFALLILAFAVLSWLKVPVGNFGDWIGGLLAFFWLMAVVTVPWNIYFRAKAVLNDAQPASDRGLPVDERQVAYVQKLVSASLWIALGLHLASAIALYVLGRIGLLRIGYAASIVALLLTGLRPTLSAYAYLAGRLHAISQGWKYPIADVVELRGRVDAIEVGVKSINENLDPTRPESLISVERARIEDARGRLTQLAADVDLLRSTNDTEHERLADEARAAISQLTTDGQFLEHVREILRFFKSA